MDLHVTLRGRRDLAGQVYRQLREAILGGRLRAGDGLPPTRELAAHLAVSRNTVTTAYERLTAEGFLAGRVGAGTFVCAGAGRAPARRALDAGDLRPRPFWAQIPPRASAATPSFDFGVGIPEARLFPEAAWRRVLGRELRRPGPRKASYGDPAGLAALRQAVARHLATSRSVQASADDVVITSGAQQAFDLIGRVLVEPGTVVAVEDPGYPMARWALAAHGARIVPVPLDDEGLQVAALPDAARLVYVTPSHQFPLGMPMSLPRRLALLAWAERRRAAVIEDDYDSELRFGGRPLEPLHALDRSGRVLYVGSFSKVLRPELRLGYLVAPPSLQPALHAARLIADWSGPAATHAALARFLDDGLLARHIRTARREYAARRQRLDRALERELGRWLEQVPAVAGLHVCARFRQGIVAADIVRAAAEAGIAVEALASYALAPLDRDGLVIGYGAIAASRIDEGIRRLAPIVEAAHRRRR